MRGHVLTIDDGYTEAGYIAEVPGLYDELRFTYRPLLHLERDAVSDQSGKSAKDFEAVLVAVMQSKLKAWEALDGKGSPMPINSATIKRLQPALFDKLYAIIAGRIPSDVDPKTEAPRQQADDVVASIVNGRIVGDVREEEDRKNSPEG